MLALNLLFANGVNRFWNPRQKDDKAETDLDRGEDGGKEDSRQNISQCAVGDKQDHSNCKDIARA